MDKKIKKYIYIRDEGKCFHCGKKLEINQVNIDHYQPKSKDGVDDYFNLVLSCKRCNKYKGTTIPKDYREIQIKLLKKAVEDRKIMSSIPRLKYNQLVEMVEAINNIKVINNQIVFVSEYNIFFVKNNNIYKTQKMRGDII
ncbi:MAG: HNH endonuclease signature motif containing protein [Bacillota bacterium]|nr:HNH endonuclease signature motif containing protein [Bacillota bacterium]